MKALDLRVVCAAWKRDLAATHLDVCHSHLVYFRILPRIMQIDQNKSWILHFKRPADDVILQRMSLKFNLMAYAICLFS